MNDLLPGPEYVRTYRKKPVMIEAIQWTGDNTEDVSK